MKDMKKVIVHLWNTTTSIPFCEKCLLWQREGLPSVNQYPCDPQGVAQQSQQKSDPELLKTIRKYLKDQYVKRK